MRATIPLSHLQSHSRPGSAARLADFVSLMKTRVMLLAVFTTFVGLMIAPGHLDPLLGSIAILAIAPEPAPPACSICGTAPTSTP